MNRFGLYLVFLFLVGFNSGCATPSVASKRALISKRGGWLEQYGFKEFKLPTRENKVGYLYLPEKQLVTDTKCVSGELVGGDSFDSKSLVYGAEDSAEFTAGWGSVLDVRLTRGSSETVVVTLEDVSEMTLADVRLTENFDCLNTADNFVPEKPLIASGMKVGSLFVSVGVESSGTFKGEVGLGPLSLLGLTGDQRSTLEKKLKESGSQVLVGRDLYVGFKPVTFTPSASRKRIRLEKDEVFSGFGYDIQIKEFGKNPGENPKAVVLFQGPTLGFEKLEVPVEKGTLVKGVQAKKRLDFFKVTGFDMQKRHVDLEFRQFSFDYK